MTESTTYMAILEEGEEKGRSNEAKHLILRLGENNSAHQTKPSRQN